MSNSSDEQPSGETPAGSGQAPIGDALANVMRMVFERGQTRAEALAADGRGRLELRQLRKDRDAMYRKLGREVRRLLEAGEIDHPGLRRGVERVDAVEARIAESESRQGALTSTEGEGEGTA